MVNRVNKLINKHLYVYVNERLAKFGYIKVYFTCIEKCLKNVVGQCKSFTGLQDHHTYECVCCILKIRNTEDIW